MKNFNCQEWTIEEKQFDSRYLGKCEAIFTQGNGYMGVRNAYEEAYVAETRNMFVSGTFNKFSEQEVTELPNLPDITNMQLIINDRPFSLSEGTIHHYSRILNLRNGETIRTIDWESNQGERMKMTFQRAVSMAEKHAIGMKATIQPVNADVEIKIISGIDGTVSNSGAQHMLEGDKRLYDGTLLEYLSKTSQSGICVATYVGHTFKLDGAEVSMKTLPIMNRRQIMISASAKVCKNSVLTIEKLSSVYTGRDVEFRDVVATEEMLQKIGQDVTKKLVLEGYGQFLDKSAKAWEDIWEKQDIIFETTNSFDQLALRFAIYHLNIMVNKEDNRVGIGAKALSGEGYKGHSFWDTEVFLLPYYLFSEPKTARNLLEYRYLSLQGARQKAIDNHYQGAMYPWEAAWIDDGEVTPYNGPADVVTGRPLIYWTGVIEQHITADVAFAVWQYYQATKDEEFLVNYGYEMIFDTARFWLSRLEWNEDKNQYEICDVIGPDEYKEHINNNAYTNYMANFNMTLARQLYDELEGTENSTKKAKFQALKEQLCLVNMREEMNEKIPKLYLPKPDEKTGIIPQFDGYMNLKYMDISRFKESTEVLTIYNEMGQEQINEYQISKQGDLVVLFYLLENLFAKDIVEKNYEFYEERTLHDSSLSKSTHSVVASDLGRVEQAYEFYEGSCGVDLSDEMKSSDAGIHSASMGGIWQAAVQGFGGIRMVDGMLRIAPVLPKECKRLVFRVHYAGSVLMITMIPGRFTITCEGKAVDAMIYDQVETLTETRTFSIR